MPDTDEKRWTCEEFERSLPELFERAQGGKLSADPRFVNILRDCPQAAELIRDLEYIAETARMLLEPEGEVPSSDLWGKIEESLVTEAKIPATDGTN
ncbi:MAG: hypothetical protein ACRYF4_13990 [Janthinobacterium lividum]